MLKNFAKQETEGGSLSPSPQPNKNVFVGAGSPMNHQTMVDQICGMKRRKTGEEALEKLLMRIILILIV